MLRLVLLFTLSSAVLVYQFYEVIPEFESKMCVFEPKENRHTHSLVRYSVVSDVGLLTLTIIQDCASPIIHAIP